MKQTILLSMFISIFSFPVFSQTFTEITEGGWGRGISRSAPAFADLDNAGLLDLVLGCDAGILYHYKQDQAGSKSFSLIAEKFNNINVYKNSAPCFTDLDNNGLVDLLVGDRRGGLYHYQQKQVGSLSFVYQTQKFSDINVGGNVAPAIIDLDGDGLLDLVVGGKTRTFHHYEQDAAEGSTFTLKSEKFNEFYLSGFVCPVFADINGDGLDDLMVGEEGGGIYYFQRNDDTGIKKDRVNSVSLKLFNNYPNPFNPVTTVQYELSESADVTISIYSTLGQLVTVLESNYRESGIHSVRWDGKDQHGMAVASGVYLCRILTKDFDQSIKLLLLR